MKVMIGATLSMIPSFIYLMGLSGKWKNRVARLLKLGRQERQSQFNPAKRFLDVCTAFTFTTWIEMRRSMRWLWNTLRSISWELWKNQGNSIASPTTLSIFIWAMINTMFLVGDRDCFLKEVMCFSTKELRSIWVMICLQKKPFWSAVKRNGPTGFLRVSYKIIYLVDLFSLLCMDVWNEIGS